MPNVLVVEDDPTMSEMVAYNLRRQGLTVEVASDGTSGLKLARKNSTALVILDLMLPGIDGLQIAQELRKARPWLPILMLTARSEESMKLKGFSAGVDDFLTKPFLMDELMARVKALLRRSRFEALRNDVVDELIFGDLRIQPADFRCWIADKEIQLRPKELALLATLAGRPGHLFGRLELAEQVWGYAHLGDTRTIDTHVKNLRRKVETTSQFNYIETVRGLGYRFKVSLKR
ncbi:MAG TPA: response regulator transcription factor [Actinomycetota bacterium]|nr:response regulator transcription factor [Actinomycetota bacterium]